MVWGFFSLLFLLSDFLLEKLIKISLHFSISNHHGWLTINFCRLHCLLLIPMFLFSSPVHLPGLWLHFKATFNHCCTVCGILGCARSPLRCVAKKKRDIFHRIHAGFAMQHFSRGNRDGRRSSVTSHICQLYLLGIGNSFIYEIMVIKRFTKSDDRSSDTISWNLW